jgi:hypothetical protein
MLGFGKRTGKVTKDGVLSIYDLAKPRLDAEKPTTEKPVATKWETGDAHTTGCASGTTSAGRARTASRRRPTASCGWSRSASGVASSPCRCRCGRSAPVEFYDKVIGMGDLEAQTMIDELGGFPTGEHFPATTNEFNAYVKAGRIIRLAEASDLAPFYANIMYGSGLGWAFNEDGSEAHNTALQLRGGQRLPARRSLRLQPAIGATRDTDPGTGSRRPAALEASRAAAEVRRRSAPARSSRTRSRP